jgi:hypothetical protein
MFIVASLSRSETTAREWSRRGGVGEALDRSVSCCFAVHERQ